MVPLETRLRRLRLATWPDRWRPRTSNHFSRSTSFLEFLGTLVDGDLGARDNKGLMKGIRAARFPVTKTLEEFQFELQPKLDVKLIKTLAHGEFITQKANVVFVGQPGTGGLKDLRGRLPGPLHHDPGAGRHPPGGALADQTVEARIAEFIAPDLVILDELGFTPLDGSWPTPSNVSSPAATSGPACVTRNKSFESWGEMFPDTVIASAVLDRLVHHATVVPIVGESFRMKDHKARQKGDPPIKKTADPPPPVHLQGGVTFGDNRGVSKRDTHQTPRWKISRPSQRSLDCFKPTRRWMLSMDLLVTKCSWVSSQCTLEPHRRYWRSDAQFGNPTRGNRSDLSPRRGVRRVGRLQSVPQGLNSRFQGIARYVTEGGRVRSFYNPLRIDRNTNQSFDRRYRDSKAPKTSRIRCYMKQYHDRRVNPEPGWS
jgi:DNA replication protein DnaC